MARVRTKQVFEAEELLEEVASWSEEEVETLPRFYREKARKYRNLVKDGQG